MFIRCLYGLQGVFKFFARSDYNVNTSLKVWPTLQLVNRSDAGSRNWWETKTRRSQIQRLRMQTNLVGTPPATLEAAGTLVVDVVCSAESAYLTARPRRCGQKGKGRHVRNASQMRWAPKHRSQKKEELLGWHPLSKWAVVNPAAKTGRKAVVCVT